MNYSNNYPYNNSNNGSSNNTIESSGESSSNPSVTIPISYGMIPTAPRPPFPPMYYAVPPPVIAIPVPGLTASVPMNPDTTGYFGNLSPNVSEDVICAILGCCGGFKRLKRPSDPSTGKPKPFALIEFDSVADLARAFRLLQDFLLDNRHLSIKIESTQGNKVDLNLNDLQGDLKCYEGISRVLIGKKLTSGGSLDWIETKLVNLRRESETLNSKSGKDNASASIQQQQQQQQQLLRDRQRNYSDLEVFDTKNRADESNEAAIIRMTDNLQALKERERRWEAKVRELEKDLRRDLEKDAEREERHAREAVVLAEEICSYSDAQFSPIYGSLQGSLLERNSSSISANCAFSTFYTSRDKWRRQREKAAEREAEIFGDCLKILEVTSAAALAAKQRDILTRLVPVDREELFAYPINWSALNLESFRVLCQERTAAFFKFSEHCSRLSNLLYERITTTHPDGPSLIKEITYEPSFLVVSNESSEADLLVMILWRWIIFLTLS